MTPSPVRVASRHLQAENETERARALMKFLGRASRSLGVGDHVYVVGGAVRNHVLGIPPKDIDVVVDSVALGGYDAAAFARDLERLIPVEVNLVTNQYGVAIITVKGEWSLEGVSMRGETIEIATARKESYGGDAGKGYKPHQVAPATIQEDLVRREFSFNTLLWRLADVAEGADRAEILDLTGRGLRDLNERIMTTPLDPDQTFSDDPSRMLRAIKFVVKYGFRIPPEVAASIRRNAIKLRAMPPDAVAKIFLKDILATSAGMRSLGLMEELGLLEVLRGMVEDHPGFRSFLASEFRHRGVQDLLELAGYGLGGETPLRGFSAGEQDRIREVTSLMEADRAAEFFRRLVKPSFDAPALIERFGLAPAARAGLAPAARRLILKEPELAFDPRALTSALERSYG